MVMVVTNELRIPEELPAITSSGDGLDGPKTARMNRIVAKHRQELEIAREQARSIEMPNLCLMGGKVRWVEVFLCFTRSREESLARIRHDLATFEAVVNHFPCSCKTPSLALFDSPSGKDMYEVWV